MNTTIEPRFLALLNDYDSLSSPSLELPPLKDPNILKASGRPLLLEPDASHGTITQTTNTQLSSNHSSAIPSLESDPKRSHNDARLKVGGRTLGETSPQSLRKILDNDTESCTVSVVKKRQNEGPAMDDFLKLPQPPTKKQKTKQVVPPIIIGLFQPPDPPSQAAMFPPIASSSFHDSHGRNTLNTVPAKIPKAVSEPEPEPEPEQFGVSETGGQEADPKARPKRNAVKTRKKWTDEETKNLFRGVAKFGSGSWTAILEDSAFEFNSRSATDLKDRYRTCRPLENGETTAARGKTAAKEKAVATTSSRNDTPSKTMMPRTKSSLMLENILISAHELDPSTDNPEENESIKEPKKRAHRLDTAELAQLGITEPIRGSGRRQRRSYTDEEDQAILQGVSIYGRSWCRIRADERLNLQSRTPTDIRDRYKYKFMSNGNSLPQEPNHHISTAQQKSMTTLTQEFTTGFGRETAVSAGQQMSSLPVATRDGLRIQEIISADQETPRMPSLQHINSLFGFKDNYNLADQPNLDSSDHMSFSQSFDWNTGVSAPFSNNIGEMDISRLLLDEPWTDMPSTKERQSFLDINSILTTSAQPLHNGPSFDHMLNFPDHLDDMNGGSFG